MSTSKESDERETEILGILRERFHSGTGLGSLLTEIIDTAIRLSSAERGDLFLVDGAHVALGGALEAAGETFRTAEEK